MTRIFPDAADYRTVDVRFSSDKREVIEKRLGFKLLPGQRDLFTYYEMTAAGGKPLGYVIPSSQKGEFGALEFVFGLDTNLVVRGIYIQRSRERDQSFRDREFLNIFPGKSIKEAIALQSTYKGKKTIGTTAVLQGVAKELVVFEDVVLKKTE